MSERHFVRTELLQSGMKIDQSIVNSSKRMLLARGTVLDDYLIEAIKKLGITGLYISDETKDDKICNHEEELKVSKEASRKIEQLRVSDRSRVTLTESVKQRISEGVAYLYSNTDSKSFTDIIKNITNELMKAINQNNALAVDISLLKVSDEYTFKHSVDVATMAMIIAKTQGMSRTEIYEVGISGLLHDIGKSKIDNAILNKQGRLTDDEFDIMKRHTTLGYDVLKNHNELNITIKLSALQHHEKINGSGYPFGLHEARITPYAKILSVADIYDALITERSYKKAFSQRDAVEILMTMTEELDINAMRSFMRSVILYPVDCIVALSNGEYARVVENHEENILRPKVVGLKTGRVYELAYDLQCANIVIQ